MEEHATLKKREKLCPGYILNNKSKCKKYIIPEHLTFAGCVCADRATTIVVFRFKKKKKGITGVGKVDDDKDEADLHWSWTKSESL